MKTNHQHSYKAPKGGKKLTHSQLPATAPAGQFAPTESCPLRQRYQMAGGTCGGKQSKST